VAQRVIYDTIALSGHPVANFEITQGLLQSCSHAHARYTFFREQQKKEKEKQQQQKKRAAEEAELSNAKKKLRTLELTQDSLNKDADRQALQAEHKNNFTLLAKSNGLRQKAKDMEAEIKEQKDIVEKISASLRKV
jgi:rubrerythrin